MGSFSGQRDNRTCAAGDSGRKITMPKTCCEGIEEAIFDELAAVERYEILYAMKERRHINMLGNHNDEQACT